MPQSTDGSDPRSWIRPYYAAASLGPAFATLSPQHQFEALVRAVAVQQPDRADVLRRYHAAAQHEVLAWLHEASNQEPAARRDELWRVRRGDRELVAVAVYLAAGIDLRLMDGTEFRRTQLCASAPLLQAVGDEWRARLLAAGWRNT